MDVKQLTARVIEGEIVDDEHEEDDPEFIDPDDFYDALDMLDSCKLAMRRIIKSGMLRPSQENHLEWLIEDIKNFNEQFQEVEEEGASDNPCTLHHTLRE